VAALFGVPQRAEWHPEIDTGEHLLLTLDVAAARQAPSTVRFALLAHDLGKALTPRSEWPRHHGHETRGLAVIERLCERLRVPQEHRELALLAARFHTHVHRGMELRGSTLLEMLEHADAFRRPDRFADFLEACECDARGRLGFADRPYPQRARVEAALAAARSVALDATERAGLAGAAIGARLRGKRLAAIEAAVPRATQSE
jgi:tRNA nucleotidyltransferase (CCA-adding enzyme)